MSDKRNRRVFPHSGWMYCRACHQRFWYEMPRGGRNPEYCEGCGKRVKREQARLRMQRMRQRRASGGTAAKSSATTRLPDTELLSRIATAELPGGARRNVKGA